MPSTPRVQQELDPLIARQYQAIKKRQLRLIFGLIAFVITVVGFGTLTTFLPTSIIATVQGIIGCFATIVLIGGGIISFMNWQCPACHMLLTTDLYDPQFCPACGVRLR